MQAVRESGTLKKQDKVLTFLNVVVQNPENVLDSQDNKLRDRQTNQLRVLT